MAGQRWSQLLPSQTCLPPSSEKGIPYYTAVPVTATARKILGFSPRTRKKLRDVHDGVLPGIHDHRFGSNTRGTMS